LAGTGIWRNPEESGGIRGKYRNSCPTEFLRNTPVKARKNRNSCDLSKTHSCEKFLQKTQEKKSSGILAGTFFVRPKK